MNAIVLAPHGDDETLFAAYTCMRERAHVIVCSQDPDPNIRTERSIETMQATSMMGCSYHELSLTAGQIDPQRLKELLEPWNSMELVASTPPRVYAPAFDPEGHEEHNLVSKLADMIFPNKVIHYGTYAPRGQRQKLATEIEPTTEEIQTKLKALACYRTQIENASTRPWFFELLDLREWLA